MRHTIWKCKAVISSIVLAGIMAGATLAWADVWVRGYTRKDGTYVAPHYRSSPDNSYNNNWSTSPNINPYTGEQGTRTPTWDDRPPVQGNDLYNTDPYDDLYQGWPPR